jgi:hypothetical protein
MNAFWGLGQLMFSKTIVVAPATGKTLLRLDLGESPPTRVQFAFGDQASEGLSDNFVRVGLFQPADSAQDFDLGQAAKERLDQRLDRKNGSIAGASIAPSVRSHTRSCPS